MALDETSGIVVDAGSCWLRAGFSGNDRPHVIIPSALGTNRFLRDQQREKANIDSYIGIQIEEMKEFLSLKYPIQRGIVTNWSDMEKLMAHCYKQLDVQPEKYSVLFSKYPLHPRSDCEKFFELMFETFNSPSIHLEDSSHLDLYTSGRGCAVIINVGEGVSYAVPFYEGFCVFDGIQRQDFGGKDITQYLQKRLHDKGYSFTTTSELEVVQEIKEKLFYTALDIEEEKNVAKSASFSINNETEVSLQDERYLCTEALFHPEMFGFQGMVGIQEMVYKAIQSCDYHTRRDICYNLMISGGSVLFPGFRERLEMEMSKLLPHFKRIKVVINDPKYSTWNGGSILSSLSMYEHVPVSKQDYEEYGPSASQISKKAYSSTMY